jgi:hypothetical protein
MQDLFDICWINLLVILELSFFLLLLDSLPFFTLFINLGLFGIIKFLEKDFHYHFVIIRFFLALDAIFDIK